MGQEGIVLPEHCYHDSRVPRGDLHSKLSVLHYHKIHRRFELSQRLSGGFPDW